MASFAKYSLPKQLATAFTPKEVEDMKSSFAKVDKDSSGSIDRNELASLLALTGDSFTADQVTALLQEMDLNSDGVVSFEEYATALHKLKKVNQCCICRRSLIVVFT